MKKGHVTRHKRQDKRHQDKKETQTSNNEKNDS